MRKTIGAIVQARMTSSRLPGKVLMPIDGTPMLAHQIYRIKQAKMLDKIIVSTSTHETDNPISELCNSIGVDLYRGSLEDVLDRFSKTANFFKVDSIVRLTADCPLIDPGLIDKVIVGFLKNDYDYFSNCNPPTYPDGLDVEIFSKEVLTVAVENAKLPSQREHVSPFIKRNLPKSKMGNLESETNYSNLRWTVDEMSDLTFVREVFSELYINNNNFTWYDVLCLIKQKPNLLNINSKLVRNSGNRKSLEMDKKFLKND